MVGSIWNICVRVLKMGCFLYRERVFSGVGRYLGGLGFSRWRRGFIWLWILVRLSWVLRGS